MEGLIPLVVNALKKSRLHQHSLKSLSDSSRRSYHHLLGGSGDSFDGSSHRRNHSEFQAPMSSMELVECGQPELADPRAPNLQGNQTRSHTNHHLMKQAHQKWL